MGPRDIERLFSQTLEDQRLSRGERQALRAVLQEVDPTPRKRSELLTRAFGVAQRALSSSADRRILDWLQEVSKLLVTTTQSKPRTADALFEPHDDCAARIISLLDRSRSDVQICVFTITDNSVVGAILGAHRRGVNVRIITDGDKAEDRGSDIARLKAEGVPVRADFASDHMHHKFAVFDGKILVTGSYNWTRGAATRNLENIVVCDDSRLVKPFRDEFARLWDVLAVSDR